MATIAPSALFTTSTLLPLPADGSSPPAQPRGEYLTIPDYRCPVDLLLFRRFKREVPGLVEQVYADPCNYGLAALGVMPPPGTRIFVRTPAPASKSNRPVISLYD